MQRTMAPNSSSTRKSPPSFLKESKVKGVKARDLIHGEEYSIEASYLVNATGAWANQFLRLAGLRIGMALSKGPC